MNSLLRGTETITHLAPVLGEPDEYGEYPNDSIVSTAITGVLIGIGTGDMERSATELEASKRVVTAYAPRGAWQANITPESAFMVRGMRYILSAPPAVWQPPAGFSLQPRVVLNLVLAQGGV